MQGGKPILYVFSMARNSPMINVSPFCIKLMLWYKVAKIPHTVKYKSTAIDKNPRKKLPFIEIDNVCYSDSRLIIEKYKEEGVDLDSKLRNYDKAISVACCRMLEEHMFWYGVASRWVRSYDTTVKEMFPKLPLKYFWLPYATARKMNNSLYAQGMGRLTPEEQIVLVKKDVLSIEALLNDSTTDFFFNSKTPTNLDVVAFSFIFSNLSLASNDPSPQFVLDNCHRIKNLLNRILMDYFPQEWKHYANILKPTNSKL